MIGAARTILLRHSLAVIALFVALGGTSLAVTGATSKHGHTYYACATARFHTLNLTTKGASCAQ
jgi:hypothetical protein